MKIKKSLTILLTALSLFTTITGEEIKEEPSKISQHFGVYDPWELLNRRIYYFNYNFDKYILLPIVDTYTFITPVFIQDRVTDFFENSENISITGNSLFQMKPKKAMRSWGRFSINMILGLGGIFDVASKLGMPKPYEDFGLTLAHYGVGEGPYLVLPFLGPSNLRDAVGSGINTYGVGILDPYEATDILDIDSPEVVAIQSIDKRKNVRFKYYSTGSPFEYEYIRYLYKKYRKLQQETGVQIF